jgi:gas vesicle protein
VLRRRQVDDVTTSINEQVSDAQRDVDSEKATLKSYIKDRLASDDKILTALPGIVSKILTGAETTEDEKSVNQWCDAIISFRTAEIRSRVDAVYLENLKQSNPDKLPKGSEDELRGGKEELQNELETLHSEIASVAEMVVEHELRKPMNEMKERKERESAQARSSWLQYVRLTPPYFRYGYADFFRFSLP